MSRSAIVMCAAIAAAVLMYAGCSGGAPKPTLEGNLLDYPEVEMVSFSIAGHASCNTCYDDDLGQILGLEVEVAPAGDPMHSMTLRIFDGLGPFSISGLRAPAGSSIEVIGTLRRTQATMHSLVEAEIPDDDGDVLALTLNFRQD